MSPRRRSPTSQPALAAFGRQMARYRLRANVVQQAIAARTNTSVSFVSQVETGKRRCKRSFAEIVDEVTGAGGALLELYDDLTKDGTPVPLWFDWPTVEQEAVMLVGYEHSLVPGLLQIPDYARPILRCEQAVSARIERQQVIMRESPAPATLVALIDELALYRPVGSPEIMRAQLEHLITVSERPNVTVQVVPAGGEHMGCGGAFVLATLSDRSEIAYLETTIRGITSDEAQDLTELSRALVELRENALPGRMSRDVIRKVAEEKWS
ncbi:helix-turn-helix domain-containing protein [Actinomadura kijaniata]|uniref:helix-turn-helix domain-containing protein n=1 Tax=Actinomadura kijaniata TaxID=46161 RepID=UPI00082DE9B3|nr:helix-turn-helix transcriptional regulator [Actinomadura kijaniata]